MLSLHDLLITEALRRGNSADGGGTDLSAVEVYVGDYLSATDLTVTTGAVNRYQRYIVGA